MVAKFNTLRAVAEQAVADGVTPGLVIAVGQGGRTSFLEAFGARAVEPVRRPATVDTVYDLASLTKALCTSVLVMRAVDDGLLALDEPMGDALPVCRGMPCAAATVRHLLCHGSGLPAHRPFFEAARATFGSPGPAARASIIERAASEPLAHPTGSRAVYSDLGFILLGALLETRTGASLDQLFAALVARVPNAAPLGYGVAETHELVAPTENCPVRGRLISGEVHDMNAWMMGGVAGHAGLFGSAPAVAAFAHALCAAHAGTSDALVSPARLRAFWKPAGVVSHSTWRLGWDGPSDHESLAGDRLSRAAVGHLGFTGCSLWIDPQAAVFVLVLANRVHPTVHVDPRYRALRRAVNDAAMAGIFS